MLSKSIVAAALVGIALASPVTTILRREGPDNCPQNYMDQCYVADIGYYSDDDCTKFEASLCAYAPCNLTEPGDYECDPTIDLPTDTPFYAMVREAPTNLPDLQLIYTQDQTCPPSGPGALLATLVPNQACVELNKGGPGPGLTIYPHGGAMVSKREAKVMKRDVAQCSGFTQNGEGKPSESASVQVSVIVDCTNGASAGCTISEGDQHTESQSTSYSATAGGGIEGVFSVSATFGMEYTDSETTTEQEDLTVPQGQKGYIAAYSAATLFSGTFTGCNSGDAEQPGTVLALKANGFTYEVVTTGA